MKQLVANASLPLKLAAAGAVALVATTAFVCILAIASYYQEAEVRLLNVAGERATVIAREVASAMHEGGPPLAQQALSALRVVPEVPFARLLDQDGRVVAQYRSPAWREDPLPSRGEAGTRYRLHPGYLENFEPLQIDETRTGTLVIATDLAPFRYDLVGFSVKVLLVAAVGVLLALLGIGRMQRRLFQPLSQLAALVQRVVTEKRYDLRAAPRGHDEVALVAAGINTMLERMSDREASLQKELSERSESQRRLEELAHFDPLTKLPNRHFFSRQLERALVEAARTGSAGAVLLIDLNNFGAVNETLGHDAADGLLLQLAKNIVTRLREGDMLCRLGGDDFGLILEQVSGESHVAAVTNKILAALREPIAVREQEVRISGCIGIAIFPVDGMEPHDVLRNADAALRRAKKSGPNTHCFFAPDMRDRTHPRLNTEFELQRALERGELRLHFQPQLRLADDELRGMEALLRWQHPERGLLLPGDFIPIAEENGALMRDISDWTVGAACAQIAAWRVEGFETVPVAVNFTPAQLRDSRIAERMQRLLGKHRVPADALELEVPENLLMAEPRAGETLVELEHLGMRIAVDDFGTGYSSLAYLKELPIRTLKIDRGFVHGLPDSSKYSSVVRAIVSLAGHLGFDTVAEGVERARQVDVLRSMGCTAYQGFCLSPALPADEAARFLARSDQPLLRLVSA